ncbi:fatty-acid amide hydrolase 2-B [Ixodes scapularis]
MFAYVRYEDKHKAVLPTTLIKRFTPGDVDDFDHEKSKMVFWVDENGSQAGYYKAKVVMLGDGHSLTPTLQVASHFHEVHGISTERITIEAMACGFEMWLSLLAVSEGDPPTAAFTNGDGSPINPWLEMLKSAIGRSAHSFPALMVTILVNHLMPKPDSSYVRRYTTMAAELRARLQSLLGDDGVLVCPTALEPAPFHNAHALRPGAVTLTAPVNIAGLPATACPVGPTRAGGRPVGVQVVAGPYRDRLCLAVASEIERAFGGWQRPCEVRCDGS